MAVLAALAVAAGGISETALAKSAEWLRRDREIIRRMNQRELAKVRQRDAYYAARNRGVRAQQAAYARRRAAYEREMADYARQRRSYNVRLSAWRRDVADCRAGVRSACRR
ncbi:MAG: hypothetical protein AB7F98_06160 [Novosphingobium sp.]